MKNLLQVLLVYISLTACLYAQSPNLVVSAGSTGQASSLTVTSDSQSPWKCFTVSGGSGQYNVVWAESNGTTGGIYFGTIALGTSAGPVTPPQPADTLPIGALTASVSAAVAGVDDGTVIAASSCYETLAKEIDAGAITSPTQLYLSLGVQTLALTDAQRTAAAPLTTAVKSWLNAQQTAGKLDETKMADYSRVFHAIAKTLKPTQGTGCPAVTPPAASAKVPSRTASQAPSAKVPSPAEPKLAPPKPVVGNSPCANGQCPAPGSSQAQPAWFRRWR